MLTWPVRVVYMGQFWTTIFNPYASGLMLIQYPISAKPRLNLASDPSDAVPTPLTGLNAMWRRSDQSYPSFLAAITDAIYPLLAYQDVIT